MLTNLGAGCKGWFDVGHRFPDSKTTLGIAGFGSERKRTTVKSQKWPVGKDIEAGSLGTLCPGDACIVNGPYGQCLHMQDTRTCTYVTFLEEPVNRIIGLYNKNCVERDGDMELYGKDGEKTSCREMDIIQFAEVFGNAYVKEFSSLYVQGGETDKCQVDGGGTYEEECGVVHRTSEYHLAVAILNLKKYVMVFPMNDMLKSFLSLGYLVFNGVLNLDELPPSEVKSVRDYISNAQRNWKYTPSKKVRRKLAHILQHDVIFYSEAMDVFKQNYKGWKPQPH